MSQGGKQLSTEVKTRSARPMIALVLAHRRDRFAIAAIALTAALSSAMEATLLVIITLAGFRLSGDGPQPVAFPLDLPLDDLSSDRLLWVGALLLALRLGATYLNLTITGRLSSSLLYRWRRRIVRSFLAASWEEQQREQDGHLQTVTQTFVGNISAVAQQLSAALTALTSFLTFVLGAFALNPIAALALLIFGAALSFVLKPLTVALRRMAGRDKAEGQEYARQLGELATAATEIRVFGRDNAFEEMLDARQVAQLAIRRRQVVLRGMTPQLFQTAGLGVVLAGLGVAMSLALDDAVLVGALVLLLIRSLGYGQAFQTNYQSIAGSRPYIDGVVDALERYEGLERARGDSPPGSGGSPPLVGRCTRIRGRPGGVAFGGYGHPARPGGRSDRPVRRWEVHLGGCASGSAAPVERFLRGRHRASRGGFPGLLVAACCLRSAGAQAI